ncbi:MAG: CehA/McbA family metallohydrolase [Clostridiales bacterium]|nr:CehA/McbA family metallohydrolase [Clostridiales bacterium]
MFKRYELHNHTTESDAGITCRELIDHMLADGVDCFAITDHNTVSGQPIIRKILAEEHLPIACAYGMEYTTYFGHIVCPVLEEYVPWDSINKKKPELLFVAAKRAGAVTGVAHPFSYGDPFARGCRFEMEITDFRDVDYIEIINNPEPLHEVNEPGILWWESLVLSGVKVAACAGMDLHGLDSMAMKFATYAEGEPGGDPVGELKAAVASGRTWVSKGMLVVWEKTGDRVRFTLVDAKKPGFVPSDTYTLTLKTKDGECAYDITSGSADVPLCAIGEAAVPKLYGGEGILENLLCVAPVIRAACL